MAKIKRSVWAVLFGATVASARRLLRNPRQMRGLIEEAAVKMRRHSGSIREISGEFQVIVRMIRAWMAGDYKDISTKSVVIFIAAVLYFLNPFDAIPDLTPVIGYVDDVSVIAWVVKTLRDELERFRAWEGRNLT
jgi:uncharacterized membrane protein YkvA (DUF1232 family)